MSKKRHYSSILSTLFGKFASKEFPAPIQRGINKSYVKLMGLDMGDFAPSSSYRSLNKLFTRALKNSREIDKNPNVVISPCDAKITDFGVIEEGRAYQIKGMSYDTAGLIGEAFKHNFSILEGGKFANFYLSPKDYHRYHIPFDLSIDTVSHIPGKLYPVNIPLLKNKHNLFIENERVVISALDKNNKRHYIILVGALNVGKMVLTFEDRIHTNIKDNKIKEYSYSTPIELKKGELFGWFEMGSTIVILSQKDAIDYDLSINQKVSFAQTIGYLGGKR